MDKDLEGAIVLAKLKDQFSDRVFSAPQLGALMRRECPDWSNEQVEALLKDADRSGSGLLRFSDLVDFVLQEAPAVVASPAFEDLAIGLRQSLGSEDQDLVTWERFRSGDPNTRYRWRQFVGRHVVFLFDTEDQGRLFEQLSLLQALQGFPVPDRSDSAASWKTYTALGRYAWGRAARITVVLPWYRPCQMERTSRWHREGADWTNTEPEGQWLDVPTAQTMVRLLATQGPPLPGPMPAAALDGRALEPLWRPPLRLLFLELHEEDAVRQAATDLNVEIRSERLVPHLMAWLLRQHATGRHGPLSSEGTFVLFPDKGAYTRYAGSAVEILGVPRAHLLWINKKRTGSRTEQEPRLLFQDSAGGQEEELTELGCENHVVIVDDFTNSGGTLFGAADLARSLVGASKDPKDLKGLWTSFLVPHSVMSYDESVGQALLGRLESLGPRCRYVTTDTVTTSACLLREHPQVDVVALTDFLAEVLE